VTPTAFTHSLLIDAPRVRVWECLTQREHMQSWMGEPEMHLEIHPDWHVGGTIIIRGVHHVPFENRGTVLVFDPPCRLVYTQWSSLSQLPDAEAAYSRFEFTLKEENGATALNFSASGFATEAIYKHLQFYWTGALQSLKQHIEGRSALRKSG
jgi:Uncharacterized conserved protein